MGLEAVDGTARSEARVQLALDRPGVHLDAKAHGSSAELPSRDNVERVWQLSLYHDVELRMSPRAPLHEHIAVRHLALGPEVREQVPQRQTPKPC